MLALQGPNLNLLGSREPGLYGAITLAKISAQMDEHAAGSAADIELAHFQSNAEWELINRIHASSADNCDFIIFNPAAFTHTSVALRDALLGVGLPFIEVHLSNVYAREPFRSHSYFSDIATGVISGFGAFGYTMALDAACDWLQRQTRSQTPLTPPKS